VNGPARIALRRADGSVRAWSMLDLEDYEWAREWTWRLANGYAARHGHAVPYLHRAVLGLAPGDGLQADHINRDTLDNRRANLRVVVHRQNLQNQRQHGGTSVFRGVSRRGSRWRASAMKDGRTHHLGMYGSELEAARVAERWRRTNMPFAQPDPALEDAA
jgi:hypothetical protein